jgi:hypothetical protein
VKFPNILHQLEKRREEKRREETRREEKRFFVT